MTNNNERRNEMKRERIRKIRKRQRIINTAVFSILFGLLTWLSLSNVYTNRENVRLTEKVNTLTSANVNMMEQINNHNNIVSELRNIIEEQDQQLINLSNKNKSMVDELNQLRTRSELYNKYEYAVIDEIGMRTELTYEEIQLGEELMLAKGYDPHLMMGTIMVESHGNPLAVNSSSGATGYGQFLNSTAKWVWTNLMGNNSYHSDIRKNGESNIRMMAEYYDYLYNTVGSTFAVIKCYSGNSTDYGAAGYLRKINNHTSRVGAIVN